MPTQYSNCKECHDLSCMTNILPNDTHENNIILCNILQTKHFFHKKYANLYWNIKILTQNVHYVECYYVIVGVGLK